MTDPWPRASTLAAVRSELSRPGAVAEGFHGLGVEPRGGDLLVVFRWRRDPNTYGVRLVLPASPAASPWTGLPVQSAQDWASDVAGLLMEQLLTALVRRAGRREVAGVVELDSDRQRGWDVTDYYVSTSRRTTAIGAVRVLAAAGIGPIRSARLLTGRTLIGWLAARLDDPTGSAVVGRAVLGWASGPAGRASLDVVIAAATPAAVARMLAHHAVHEAAEAGATEITTTSTHRSLPEVGFRPTHDGSSMALDTRQIGE